MTTGFVLSGGGSLGAIQVGMLRTLLRHDVVPDLVVGTSIGGLNAVAFAADPTVAGVATLAGRWGEIQRHDVYPLDPGEVWRAFTGSLPLDPVGGALRALGVRNAAFPVRPVAAVLGAFGLRDYLVPSRPRESFLAREIPVKRLEDATLPVTVTATGVTTGRQVALSSGPAVPALLATSAIPGVFEPVTIDGRALMDGGIADNTAIDLAVARGAEVVYVLPTGFSCDLPRPPATALGMAVHALAPLIEQRLIEASHRASDGVELHIVPPLCPLTVVPVDFSHSEDLIERADTATEEWLATGQTAAPPGTRFLGEPGYDARSTEPTGIGDAGSPTMRPT